LRPHRHPVCDKYIETGQLTNINCKWLYVTASLLAHGSAL